MNAIFLDIDGVLNYGHTRKIKDDLTDESREGFDPILLGNLKRVLETVPETKIVISSSWRVTNIMDHISKTKPWIEVFKERIGIPDCIAGEIGVRCEFKNIDGGRAGDISEWLNTEGKKLGVVRFVIVDDMCSAGDAMRSFFPNNFIDCDKYGQIGLSDKIADMMIYTLTGGGKDITKGERVWFTSDQHFGHANIIRYCNRPFKDTTEMDAYMIGRWNSVVGNNDIVWCLGDICLGKRERLRELVPALKGRINLVMGNHDTKNIRFYYDMGFNKVYDKPILLNGFILLSHEPLTWVQRPMFNIFGHVHDSQTYSTFSKDGCCVCVERHNYTPISLDTIKEHCGSEDPVKD